MNMRAWHAALAALAVCLPSLASAWGEEGHRLTGLVAQQLLTPKAQQGVRALMGRLDLANEALYLDQHKAELNQKIPGSRQWHYDDRPVCDPQVPKASYCTDGHCATTQALAQYRTLIDRDATLEERRFALRALVHLVGDMHQPLHASDHDDAGGNGLAVKLPRPGSPLDTDLHSAWDSTFVAMAVTQRRLALQAQAWLAAAAPADLAAWKKGSPATWGRESYELAQSLAYGALPGFRCPAEDFDEQRIALDDDYVARATAAVPQQLLKAGVRIATLLNRAFGR